MGKLASSNGARGGGLGIGPLVAVCFALLSRL